MILLIVLTVIERELGALRGQNRQSMILSLVVLLFAVVAYVDASSDKRQGKVHTHTRRGKQQGNR